MALRAPISTPQASTTLDQLVLMMDGGGGGSLGGGSFAGFGSSPLGTIAGGNAIDSTPQLLNALVGLGGPQVTGVNAGSPVGVPSPVTVYPVSPTSPGINIQPIDNTAVLNDGSGVLTPTVDPGMFPGLGDLFNIPSWNGGLSTGGAGGGGPPWYGSLFPDIEAVLQAYQQTLTEPMIETENGFMVNPAGTDGAELVENLTNTDSVQGVLDPGIGEYQDEVNANTPDWQNNAEDDDPGIFDPGVIDDLDLGDGFPRLGSSDEFPGIPGIEDWFPDAGQDDDLEWPGIPVGIPGSNDSPATPTAPTSPTDPTVPTTPTTPTNPPADDDDNGFNWPGIPFPFPGDESDDNGGDPVGTTLNDLFTDPLGSVSSVVSSIDLNDLFNQAINIGVSDYASDQFGESLDDILAFNQGQYDQGVAALDPYNQLGLSNIAGAGAAANTSPALSDLTAGQISVDPNQTVTPVPVNQVDVTQMTDNPFYQAMLAEGNRNVLNSGVAAGRYNSGGTLAGLEQIAAATYGSMMPVFQDIQASQDSTALAANNQEFNQGSQNIVNSLAVNDQLFGQGLNSNTQSLNADNQIFNQLNSLVSGGQNAAGGQGNFYTGLVGANANPLTAGAVNDQNSTLSYIEMLSNLFGG